MFALLDSQFNINLLRFASTNHYRSFCFARGVFAAPVRVYTTEPCAVPGGLYTQGTVLLLEVFTPQGPELHLEVSTLQRPVLHLEVSTPQRLKLHLDLTTLQRCVQHLELTTPQGPELHLDVSTLKRPVLLLEVSTSQSLSFFQTCLQYRGMCCSRRYLHCRGLNCICSRGVYTQGLHLHLVGQQELMLLLDVSTVHFRGMSCICTFSDYSSLSCFLFSFLSSSVADQ